MCGCGCGCRWAKAICGQPRREAIRCGSPGMRARACAGPSARARVVHVRGTCMMAARVPRRVPARARGGGIPVGESDVKTTRAETGRACAGPGGRGRARAWYRHDGGARAASCAASRAAARVCVCVGRKWWGGGPPSSFRLGKGLGHPAGRFPVRTEPLRTRSCGACVRALWVSVPEGGARAGGGPAGKGKTWQGQRRT